MLYLQVEGQVRDKKGHARPQHPQRPQPRLLVVRLAPVEAARQVRDNRPQPVKSSLRYLTKYRLEGELDVAAITQLCRGVPLTRTDYPTTDTRIVCCACVLFSRWMAGGLR